MPIELYDATVDNFRQGLGGVAGFMQTARAHFEASGTALQSMVDASLHPTMKPLSFQIRSVVHHSVAALEGLRQGTFSPPPPAPQADWQALEAVIEEARAAIAHVTREELSRLEGNEVVFTAPGRTVPFAGGMFLLTFSVPNFYFHATTAYDILRLNGAPLQKRDYLGPLRTRTA